MKRHDHGRERRMTAANYLELDIFSDPICPWCYIGKRRLEKALAERPNLQIQKRWRVFQLNPEMPPEGMERQQYLRWKFGGETNAQGVYDRIARVAREEGLAVDFARIGRTPSTRNAHRLIRFAGKGGNGQDKVVEALFEAYFVEGQDIGMIATLSEIAETNGFDPEEVRAFLLSDEDQAAVTAEDAWGRDLGIQGVPCFVLERRHGLSGAHPPEVLLQMLDLATQGGSGDTTV
jgi:predicted DsbA family dithiol-disulfide isomerase